MKIESIPLGRLTTLGIGGVCDVWTVETPEDLVEATRAPYRILGGGSNLVVSDRGLPERIIRLGGVYAQTDLGIPTEAGTHVTGWIGAGRPLPGLIRLVRTHGLSGLEGLVGIPAQVGGAVWMNAGTRFGEMFDALHELEILGPDGFRQAAPTDLPHQYRSSGLVPGEIVTRVKLKLTPASPESIRAREMQADQARKGQPKAKTAGCAFKNPMVGGTKVSAGLLIDQAGLKGLQIGDAVISKEHGNFVLNLGQATCTDVKMLLGEVQNRLGISLDWEYELWE